VTDRLIDEIGLSNAYSGFAQYYVINSNTDRVADEYSSTIFLQRKPVDELLKPNTGEVMFFLQFSSQSFGVFL
jgi:hypothetical protein